ncbi:hypothetical protein RhiirC2_781041 [Rhizophagus irregularis]|uniref:Protein kinase domain-containing protein n=1 Tax=Rhizophagus irregularis TaxID=588596 RepID=A0A2N1N667_9GLOM|nr:hypothetical protein RhiirC2_781041 [Rhizophagus irregularis]
MKVALKVLIDKKTLIIKEDDIKKIFSSKYQRFPWNNKSKMILEIIEYANEGNLRDYLNEKFDSLQWENKIQMAFDITSGLKCLHSKNIIHRHLNEIVEYIDSQCFKDIKYVRSKKSDIYSLGVVLWKNTSGRPPFLDDNVSQDKSNLRYHISHLNLREEPIEGTVHL